ncbi:helix-turn-helix transcriptional regulator [Patulibacter sp. NPDC049589]|uniref:helix-turn-helix domain-containing protein n=1 Tax=Patulibacter sp. NPDC049589 TaxID=3154731 RepID=UPI00344A46FB
MSTPLGDFVRARRDAVPPHAVGLTAGPRRRVPGLRRSELAQLAGISVEYLVRIEQGTDRNPSAAVLASLAAALRLDPSDHARLRHVAKITGGGCPGSATRPHRTVRPRVLTLLRQFEPAAAIVTDRTGEVLAHTDGFELLARPVGILDPAEPNLTRFVFLDPRARDVFPDWEHVADELAADLWLGPSRERSASFREELGARAGAAFTDRLERHTAPAGGVLRWVHPVAGELRLERETMELPPADAQQLVAFLPADGATTAALDGLRHAAATPLRAVG